MQALTSRHVLLLPVAVCVACALLPSPSQADIYRVGPSQEHKRVSDVTRLLKPGDIVEVTGDISDSFVLARHGTEQAPITVRGVTRVENGRIVRPRIDVSDRPSNGIICRGDWSVIEGLDISGAASPETFRSATAVTVLADHVVIRNCRIHHNLQGIFSDYQLSGNILIEFCEFSANGGAAATGSNLHSVFLSSHKLGACATIRHCRFADAIGGGAFVKSRMARNRIEYNWFESPYNYSLTLVDTQQRPELSPALYPMHSDIVGNVFFEGWSAGPQFGLLSLGGEDAVIPGTEGDFNISHNLFVMTRRCNTPAVLVHGNVDRVCLYNNAFTEYGVDEWLVYERGFTWDVERTVSFAARRGSREPIVEGANNWVSGKGGGIPEGLDGTLRGLDPGFVDLLEMDFRPQTNSLLARAALPELPQGRIGSLIPEYEPTPSIPSDLKPVPRRKVAKRAIGPFEAAP